MIISKPNHQTRSSGYQAAFPVVFFPYQIGPAHIKPLNPKPYTSIEQPQVFGPRGTDPEEVRL